MTEPEKKEDPPQQTPAPSPAITNKESDTITESPSEEMEVHHHSHSHGKKSWKSYIWEFLMLFLAVFCGFLAEYQLEHTIEHQREKEFIRSMIEDLEDDQQKLAQYLSDVKQGLSQMDTLITILDNNMMIRENGSQLYYLARVSPRFIIFRNNNRTVEQLKNSGSFRLIRNAPAADRITEYYGRLGHIRHLEDLYFREFEQYKKIASGIFEPSVLRSMETPNGEITRQAENPSLRTNDSERLKELGVYAIYMNGSRRSIAPASNELKQNGNELISFLKKEYQLN